MPHRGIAALKRTLSPHFGLSNSRVETMALFVTGMISARTVNLSHIAGTRSTGSSREISARIAYRGPSSKISSLREHSEIIDAAIDR